MCNFYLMDGEVDSLKCTEEDRSWSFVLPEVVGSDKKTITISLVAEDEFSKMFEFYSDSGRVTLLSRFANELAQGNFCPNRPMQLTFSLESNVLGSNRHSFDVNAEPPGKIELYDFDETSLKSSLLKSSISELEGEGSYE